MTRSEPQHPWCDRPHGEGPNDGSSLVREQELIAAPLGMTQTPRRRRREQEPDAGCRLVDDQALEISSGQRYPDQAVAQIPGPLNRHGEEPRRFPPAVPSPSTRTGGDRHRTSLALARPATSTRVASGREVTRPAGCSDAVAMGVVDRFRHHDHGGRSDLRGRSVAKLK